MNTLMKPWELMVSFIQLPQFFKAGIYTEIQQLFGTLCKICAFDSNTRDLVINIEL